MRWNLARKLNDAEWVLYRAAVDVGTKTICSKLPGEIRFKITKDMAQSFMERVMAVQTITKSNEDMNSTVIQSDSNNTALSCHRCLRPLLGHHLTREAISSAHFSSLLLGWKPTMRSSSQIAWPNGPTLYSNRSSKLSGPYSRTNYKRYISAQIMVSKPPCQTSLNKLWTKWSDLVAPLQYLRPRCTSLSRNIWADSTVKSVLSDIGLIVAIAETVGKMEDGAVNEYCKHDMEKLSSTAACTELLMECSTPRLTRPSKISIDFESL